LDEFKEIRQRFDRAALQFGREGRGIKAVLLPDMPSWIIEYADKLFIRAFRRLVKTAEANKILDVGCGVGRLTFKLSELGHTIGIDISCNMVKIAHEKAKKLGIDVDFCVMSNYRLGFVNELADMILSSGVLEYIIDDEHLKAALNEFARVAKPGSKILLMEPITTKPLTHYGERKPPDYWSPVPSVFCLKVLQSRGVKLVAWTGICAEPLGSLAVLLGRINIKLPKISLLTKAFIPGLFLTAALTQNAFKNASLLKAFLLQKQS